MKVAAIGECMIELLASSGNSLTQSFGGDTLNTAIYLTRLGVSTDYLTALGHDRFSDEMISRWTAEGLGVSEVLRLPGRLPGLYMIQIDAKGERSFLYWRDSAPARDYFKYVGEDDIIRLSQYDWLYFSGITLSLYDDKGRDRLLELIKNIRQRGGRIAFDGNYRPRGWPDQAAARKAFEAILPYIDLALPTFEDENILFGDADAESCALRLKAAGVQEIVVKCGAQGCFILSDAAVGMVPAVPDIRPVDTTAAGDSFNAAYLAARIEGSQPEEAARLGHQLAAAVIRHPGALIPREASPPGRNAN